MSDRIKKTKWKYTNDVIRNILIDCYVNSPVFKILEECNENALVYSDPDFNKKLKRKFDENPVNIIPDNLFNKEDTDKINFAWYVMNNIIQKAAVTLWNPLQKDKWDLTIDSFMNLDYRLKNTRWALSDIKDKYGLSYPTLSARLPLFFDIKTVTKWKAHYKYLYPKKEVLVELARYYAERRLVKNWKNLYLEIIDLFKDVDLKK